MSLSDRLLVLIVFLDSLCIGLTVPVLSPHVFMMEGNHITLGALTSMSFICHLYSKKLMTDVAEKCGAKLTLSMSLIVSLISYIILIFSSSIWLVFLSRLIFSFASQIEALCKQLIPKESIMNTTVDAFSIAGVVVGPILGGYIFDLDLLMSHNATAALIATLFSLLLIPIIETDNEEDNKNLSDEKNSTRCKCQLKSTTSTTSIRATTVQQHLRNLSQIDYKRYWNVLLLRLTLASMLTMFFMKFSLLLKCKHKLNVISIGYTIAYQNIITFAAGITVHYLDRSRQFFAELSLIMLSFTLVALCTVHTFDYYLLLFIPMVVARAVIDKEWSDAISSNNKSLNSADTLMNLITGAFTPLAAGILCQVFHSKAFRVVNVVPVVVTVHILAQLLYNSGDRKRESMKQD